MKIERVREIANAVLYEGYLLYPYRHSAIKNRQRWSIGVVYPREYSAANGAIEPWYMRTECLLTCQDKQNTALDIDARFLHLFRRTALPATDAAPGQAQGDTWSLASRLENEAYEEGIERDIRIVHCLLRDLVAAPLVLPIHFPGQRIADGTIVRKQLPVSGTMWISAAAHGENIFKLCVQIENTTPETGIPASQHNKVLLQSFISTHIIFQIFQGDFISLLDPPGTVRALAQTCQNIRTWPVLVGDQGETDTLLSSPIILYDYPQIAPESPGSLFDSTEIDEILTLRILTLTEEEKAQMRQGDERAREILERTEALTPEQLMKLHGTVRSLKPVDEENV